MNPPLVSIVIPVYNGAGYLREAIDSALSQTWDNCEVIVVNDGSTDGTEEICLGYGDRIRYFAKANGGVATALNLGICRMRGAYFAWLSHDDVYYPRKTEEQMAALRKDGDLTKIVINDYDEYYQDTGVKRSFSLTDDAEESDICNSVFTVVKALIRGAPLIHNSHFERAGLFNPGLLYVQDYDMWFRLARGRRLVYVNKPLYIIRRHSAQATRTKRPQMQIEETRMWKGYTETLSDSEMREIYGGRFLFLFEMWYRMRLSGYEDDGLYGRLARERADVVQKLKRAGFSLDADEEISIFGAGYRGLWTYRLLRLCGASAKRFWDNDPQKHNTAVVDGVLCEPARGLTGAGGRITVIVAIEDGDSVVKQLARAGVTRIVTYRQIEQILRDTSHETA
jgi:glycosyltransferase involved in cell wall biosynthesis